MLTHLFFDFFGTLVDYSASRTEQGYEQSHRILTDAGCELGYDAFLQQWDQVASRFEADARISLIEYSMDQVCGAFLERVLGETPSTEILARFRDRYLAEWNSGVVYLPGVPAMLERLSEHYTLVLITNTHSAELVPEHLQRMGVASRFEEVITSVEHGRRKPHPELFEHSLSRVSAAPETSAYIGDSFEADYQGSRGVGMTCYLIDPDFTADVPTRARLSSIFELEKKLEA